MKKLEKRVKRYLPFELDVDTSYLNNTQVCHHCLLNECKCVFLRSRKRCFTLVISIQEQVLESLINAASYMNDIFEMQVNIHFFRLSLIRSTESTTVGDCRDISFINNHKTGVEGFRGEEKTAGG